MATDTLSVRGLSVVSDILVTTPAIPVVSDVKPVYVFLLDFGVMAVGAALHFHAIGPDIDSVLIVVVALVTTYVELPGMFLMIELHRGSRFFFVTLIVDQYFTRETARGEESGSQKKCGGGKSDDRSRDLTFGTHEITPLCVCFRPG